MMLDADVVAVSPSSVYRVLRDAGLMNRHNCKPSLKGKGFDQPAKPHEHWHVDFAYINVAGTFFFLCTLLDGYSRFIVHWEIRPQMTEADVETIIQRRRAKVSPTNGRGSSRTTARSSWQARLQGVYSPHLRYDSCEDVAFTAPSKQR